MDNQYNYYTGPETGSQNTNPEMNQGMHQNMHGGMPPKKPKKGVPKWAKATGIAVVFGLVAGCTFQGTGYMVTKFLGKDTASQESNSVSSTKLTTSSDSSVVTTDVTKIVDSCMPSVVSITNMSVQQVQSFFGGTQEQESESAGSGIIIGENDTELLIATNYHVVEGSDTLTVTFIDEESVEANLKGSDSSKDLAVIAVSLDDIKDSTKDEIKVATLGDSDSLQVGEPAVAIGNALGYGQSVTTGVISATNRQLDGYSSNLIQTDAAINPGNSGGALLNSKGEVIGINSAKIAESSVEGIGYAIPISDVSDTLTDLMNQETKTKVAEDEQGQIGIQGVDVTEDSAQMYNIPTGVYVSSTVKGGGAEKAGLSKGMVITGINGTTVDSMSTLQEQLQYYKAGETVTLTVQVPSNSGEYQEKEIEVTLGSKS